VRPRAELKSEGEDTANLGWASKNSERFAGARKKICPRAAPSQTAWSSAARRSTAAMWARERSVVLAKQCSEEGHDISRLKLGAASINVGAPCNLSRPMMARGVIAQTWLVW